MTDDDKPYIGKRGPRKTKPPGSKQRPDANKVTLLFGEQAGKEAWERAESASRPFPEKGSGVDSLRVQKRRKKMRMGEKWTRVMDDLKASGRTMADFVGTLTPEELARGQLKADDGSFRGGPPHWVPAEFHKACIRELMSRGKVLYQESYLEAIKSMTGIANDPRVDPGQRIRAAQFVIERIEGKVPEKLEISAEEPWQKLLAGVVAELPPGSTAAMRAYPDVLDGEVVSDEVG